MDLNAQPPAIWTLANGPYEIADHCIEKKTNILLLLNAWLDSGEELDSAKDWGTLNFWVTRLKPLWARSEEPSDEDSGDESNSEVAKLKDESTGTETIVIVCNRCGKENGACTSLHALVIELICYYRQDVCWLFRDFLAAKGLRQAEASACYG